MNRIKHARKKDDVIDAITVAISDCAYVEIKNILDKAKDVVSKCHKNPIPLLRGSEDYIYKLVLNDIKHEIIDTIKRKRNSGNHEYELDYIEIDSIKKIVLYKSDKYEWDYIVNDDICEYVDKLFKEYPVPVFIPIDYSLDPIDKKRRAFSKFKNKVKGSLKENNIYIELFGTGPKEQPGMINLLIQRYHRSNYVDSGQVPHTYEDVVTESNALYVTMKEFNELKLTVNELIEIVTSLKQVPR